jgi:beta-glucosidase/6-phospho-beta-glucosidase/beta-galactosidase
VITENGTCEDEPNVLTAKYDEGRRQYFEGYIRACGEAIDAGVKLQGYFIWSLMVSSELTDIECKARIDDHNAKNPSPDLLAI